MQEQSPLRPGFVRIRDGFIAFLKQPPGTPLETIIPQSAIDAMATAAKNGSKRRRRLEVARIAAATAAVAGTIVAIAFTPMVIGVAILLGGGVAFLWAHDQLKVRREPEIDELATGPGTALEHNLRALDDFRHLIACGDIACEERLPDGTIRPLPSSARRAFLADHGALLVLSREQSLWRCIPHRPLPMSQLWIKPDSRVAPTLVTSRTLLDTVDRDLFDRRIQWLLDRSGNARAFRDAIAIIVALRRPDLDGRPFEDKKAVLREEGFSDSRMEKIHAGVYPPFNNFLRRLPMHEFP
ncbi:hypothetical protein [Pelagerythrobacter aerophilus]|nr:hypothetical protein [Pelagerythrobacter aerophilus]